MSKPAVFILSLGAVLLVVFNIVPAQAQATRTWVSGVGDDANPCSRTAPCKTFAGAISKTAVSGEINVLDPGGFGAVTVTKSISIRADHVEGGVLVSAGDGIIVNVGPTEAVLLEGLDIEGLGSGLHGISVIGGGTTTIVRCAIRHFAGNGVDVSGSGARAYVTDSIITNNAGGVHLQGSTTAFIRNSLLDKNTSYGVQTEAGSWVALTGSTLTGSPSSIVALGGSSVVSYGNNVLRNAGAPTQTLSLQ